MYCVILHDAFFFFFFLMYFYYGGEKIKKYKKGDGDGPLKRKN